MSYYLLSVALTIAAAATIVLHQTASQGGGDDWQESTIKLLQPKMMLWTGIALLTIGLFMHILTVGIERSLFAWPALVSACFLLTLLLSRLSFRLYLVLLSAALVASLIAAFAG